MNHSFLFPKAVSFVLFPEASEPGKKLYISRLVYFNSRHLIRTDFVPFSPLMKTRESHSFTFCCGPSHSIQEVFRKMFRTFYFLSFFLLKIICSIFSLSSFLSLIFGDFTFCRAKSFFFHSPVSSVSQLPRLIHQSTQFWRKKI